MSDYAKKAIVTAAAEDADLKSRLSNSESFEAAASEVLSLTEAEKQEVRDMLSTGDDEAPVMDEAEERNNPGPGFGV